MRHASSTTLAAIIVLSVSLLPACSVRKFAVNRLGDAIASGGSTWQSDDDIEFVGEALPFSLKLIESLLEVSPDHPGMLLTACQGFATYAYVYIHQDADMLAPVDFTRARTMRARARRMYDRAMRYGRRAIEQAHPGMADRLPRDPAGAAAMADKAEDVPLLYWNAVAIGLAISASKDDAAMLARIPEVEALIARALDLDPAWEAGSLYEMRIVLAGAKPSMPDEAAVADDYARAVDLSGDGSASVHVAYAEAVALRNQDRGAFVSLLDRAIAIDADRRPATRMANLVAQRRARWLMGRVDDLILEGEDDEGGGAR